MMHVRDRRFVKNRSLSSHNNKYTTTTITIASMKYYYHSFKMHLNFNRHTPKPIQTCIGSYANHTLYSSFFSSSLFEFLVLCLSKNRWIAIDAKKKKPFATWTKGLKYYFAKKLFSHFLFHINVALFSSIYFLPFGDFSFIFSSFWKYSFRLPHLVYVWYLVVCMKNIIGRS